jgi:hypothetical protein
MQSFINATVWKSIYGLGKNYTGARQKQFLLESIDAYVKRATL